MEAHEKSLTTHVGIRELKARLSHYIELAVVGERIVVTDRGKPKAMLIGLERDPMIEQGIEQGWIRSRKRPPAHGRRRKRAKGRYTIEQVMAEDRGEPDLP